MKTIITILFALVAMAGLAKQKTIVWENPAIGYSDKPYFEIHKVELTKEKTALHVRVFLVPEFRIKSACYLQSDGKRYDIIGSDSIQLDGNNIPLDNTGKKDFVLYFKPLPLDTKEFDFIEGMNYNDFQVFAIHDKN